MSTSCSCVRCAHHGMHCVGGRRPTWVHKASMVLRAVTSVLCAMAVRYIGLSGNCTNNSPHPPLSITPYRTPPPLSITPYRTPPPRSITPCCTPPPRSITPCCTPPPRSITPCHTPHPLLYHTLPHPTPSLYHTMPHPTPLALPHHVTPHSPCSIIPPHTPLRIHLTLSRHPAHHPSLSYSTYPFPYSHQN